ncbi:MAG: hypothetical protein FWG34_01545 [Oscillospiraceae bacterium]|nr:hypothetical protein [Oscillospiraceae bacterium]
MKQTIKLFQIGLKQISKDGILFALAFAPFLIGIVFKFVIPIVSRIMEDKLSFSLLFWYGLIDGMLICLTPAFTAMITAFLLLEERDEGIGAFYQVTPAEGYSYLMARIGIPMIWAFISTIATLMIFNISALSYFTIFSTSVVSTLTGALLAMTVVSIANNRVEGLALSKLTGISFLGLAIVWFIPAPYQYFVSFLPSFWIGNLIMRGANLFDFIFGILSCFLWIVFFTKKFLDRIN